MIQTKPGLVALYDIWPGNGAGLFLQPRSPYGASQGLTIFVIQMLIQSVACSPSHQQSPYRSLKVIYIVLVAQWLHTIYTLPHHGHWTSQKFTYWNIRHNLINDVRDCSPNHMQSNGFNLHQSTTIVHCDSQKCSLLFFWITVKN